MRYSSRRGGVTIHTGHRQVTDMVKYHAVTGLWRYRWHLAPLYVALPMPFVGWLTALTYWVWPEWTLAAYGVAALCATAWVTRGCRALYDRALAAAVSVLALGWMLSVATQPDNWALYGVWILGWPIVGLFWWCGGAFRTARARNRLRKKWAAMFDTAGLGGAKILRIRDTTVGRIVEAELPGGVTQKDVKRDRLEAAGHAKPGSLHIVNSKSNASRVTIHSVELDPWEDGAEEHHPVLSARPEGDD